ncbi:hypothetical protein LOAG_03911 [Loa loa]|uniref:Uncharacterized protein n=1 Tax=Loa loa TaxID=7209 RepID=A0A1S0U3T4_LOALO|nr:hypothetical protein LOAG_03911 [Loa loa]EFO24574.1 hypothetical protein LOAG_03911 [Loa loa]
MNRFCLSSPKQSRQFIISDITNVMHDVYSAAVKIGALTIVSSLICMRRINTSLGNQYRKLEVYPPIFGSKTQGTNRRGTLAYKRRAWKIVRHISLINDSFTGNGQFEVSLKYN